MSFFELIPDDCKQSRLCCHELVHEWGQDVWSPTMSYKPPRLPGHTRFPDEGQSDWIFVTKSRFQAYGILSDGSLWGWGAGPLGDGTDGSSDVPRFIHAGPWDHVFTSHLYPSTPESCYTLAIKSDGTMWAWGDNTVGQLGTGRPSVYAPFTSGTATLEDGYVSSISFTTGGFTSDGRDGYVASFTLSNVFAQAWEPVEPPDNYPEVEARLVGDGLTWDTGEPLSITFTDIPFGHSTTRIFAASYESTQRRYDSKPSVIIKRTEANWNLRPRFRLSLYSYATVPGLDAEEHLGGLRPSSLTYIYQCFNKTPQLVRVTGGGQECFGVTCGALRWTVVDTFDAVGYWNGLSRGLIKNDFVQSIQGGIGDISQAVSLGSGIVGTPSATLNKGDGEVSVAANFDGALFISVSDPGSNYNTVTVTSQSYSGESIFCGENGKTPFQFSGVTHKAVVDPDTAEPATVSLSPTVTSRRVTYEKREIPLLSWSGSYMPETDHMYAVFGEPNTSIEQGCWKINRDGPPEVIRQGGQFTEPPAVRFYTYGSPVMRQIDGSWKYASDARFSSGTFACCATDQSGRVYVWGSGATDYTLTSGPPPLVRRDCLPQYVGEFANIECQWNEDSLPKLNSWPVYSYTVDSARLYSVDDPQYRHGAPPSDLSTSRRSDDWKFYADSLPNNAFHFSRESSRIVLNEFTGEPVTAWAGGFGYETTPLVHFVSVGNPLVTVTTTLEPLPAFAEITAAGQGYARTESGELWATRSGWRVQGESQNLVARRADFSASPVYDAWYALFDGDRGGSSQGEVSPEEACGEVNAWAFCNGEISPGDILHDGAYTSLQSSPVTHSTVETVSLATHYLLVFDNGGSGFDDYEEYSCTVTLPPIVSLSEPEYSTKLSGSVSVPSWTPSSGNAEAFFNAGVDCYKSCNPDYVHPWPWSPPQPIPEKDLGLPESCVHYATTKINRTTTPLVGTIEFKTWRGSIFPTAEYTPLIESGIPRLLRADMDPIIANGDLTICNAFFIKGPFESGVEPTVQFTGGGGTLPSYRIVPITGGLRQTYGPTKVGGNWSDFGVESSKRKISLAPIEDAHGIEAPASESDFVKTKNGFGLKADGSLWRLGDPHLRPSVCTGNLEVRVSASGSGYKVPATAIVSKQLTGVATASAKLNGQLSAIAVIDGGSGYRSPPTLEIDGDAAAEAVISGPVDSISVTANGDEYKAPPRVRFSQPGFSAFAKAKLAGRITGVEVLDGGNGYTSPPVVSFNGSGEGASATASISGIVESLTLQDGGEYESAPTVVISGGGGGGAQATAIMGGTGTKKYVKSLEITSFGSGYSSTPQVTFTGGDGSGAAATARINASVSSITLTSEGDGYDEDTQVLIAGNAKAVASLSFKVSEVSITSGGRYRSAPSVTFESSGAVSKVQVSSKGSSYASAPTVVIAGGVGAGAEAVAVVGGKVDQIKIISSGAKYKSPPTVVIEGGCDYSVGSPAKATASLNSSGGVSSITLVSQGSGYRSTPKVTIKGGGGSGCTAEAVLDAKVEKVVVTRYGSGYDDDAKPSVLFVGGGGDGAAATVTVEKAGSGAEATAYIDGSVIFAKVTSPGSNYESDPEITVSGGEQTSEGRVAVLRAAIEGQATATVQNGGVNYVSTGSGHDRHGKRIFSQALFSGGISRMANAIVTCATSSNGGGGGAIQTIPTPQLKFRTSPSVHFLNTVSVGVITRLTVDAVAIGTGASLLSEQIPCTDAVAKSEFITRSHKFGEADDIRGMPTAACVYYLRAQGITPHRFRQSSGRPYKRPFLSGKVPVVTAESELAGGASLSLSINEEGLLIDPDTNIAATSESAFAVSSPGSNYSSGLIARTATPGIAEFIAPTVSVSVQDGSVISAELGDEGNLRKYLQFGQPSLLVDVIVHGGGGSGARVSFSPVASLSASFSLVVEDGGSGYSSTPSATVVARRDTGSDTVEPIYGWEHSRDESDWPTWEPVMKSDSKCVPEYATGSTDGQYISTFNGRGTVTNDGLFAFCDNGFVSYAFIMNGGGAGENGPACLQNWTSPPEVTVSSTACDQPASVSVDVVSWSSTFDGWGGGVVAVRD